MMNTSLNLQPAFAPNEAEHAPQRRSFIKRASTGLVALGSLVVAGGAPAAQTRPASPARSTTQSTAGRLPEDADNFYQSRGVTVRKVRFKNQYEMDVAGNLFVPNNLNRSSAHAAIIVGHPMGAVKEQSANLYATKMAEQGFVTLSIDLPFWGESEGRPRNVVSPDLYAEAFSAAVDYLGTQRFVNQERIGVLGICGSGGFAISAAKIDPRMKAIATVSMYDMGAANRDALNKSQTLTQRKAIIAAAAEQRYLEFTGGETKYTSGTVHEITERSHQIEREF
jgi:fermentation-respiration switch protein FrsA (DUF1100 family)